MELYNRLEACYGQLNWWPAPNAYEVMVGAILTQNTAWTNVEKAIANFQGRLNPQLIAKLPLEDLRGLIRPAGFFNQKSLYLKELTTWYSRYDYSVEAVQQQPQHQLRKELLALKGIGPETADSILLYAFGMPSFVVDAYTKRLLQRLPVDVPLDYGAIQAYFEQQLPRQAGLYNNYHALIVEHAKQHCRKKPACNGCPLAGVCAAFKE